MLRILFIWYYLWSSIYFRILFLNHFQVIIMWWFVKESSRIPFWSVEAVDVLVVKCRKIRIFRSWSYPLLIRQICISRLLNHRNGDVLKEFKILKMEFFYLLDGIRNTKSAPSTRLFCVGYLREAIINRYGYLFDRDLRMFSN